MEKKVRDYFFGINLLELYEYDFNKTYDFVKLHTDYLESFSKLTVKEICISVHKDIIILLKSGLLFLNGKPILKDIDRLFCFDRSNIIAISFHNRVNIVTFLGSKSDKYINNNNYRYKKIIEGYLTFAALDYEGNLRVFVSFLEGVIDPERFFNVEDIKIELLMSRRGHEYQEIMIYQNNEWKPLFI